MVKLAFLGWGKESFQFYKLLQHHIKAVDLIGISSQDEEVLNQIKRSSEIKLVERDYRRLLGFHDLDGVIIASGNDRNIAMVVDAFEAGKHVLMCNPITTNVSEALTIKAKADQYSTQYASVGLPRRFDANLQEVKKILSKGSLGKISSIRTNTIIPKLELNLNSSKTLRAGLYMDSMVDDIDMIHFLTMDTFADVHARGCIRRFEELERIKDIDTAMISGRMNSGIRVQMQALVSLIPGPLFEIEIEGEHGRLKCTDANWCRDISIQSKKGGQTIKSEITDSWSYQLIHSFSDSIAKKKAPEDTITDAILNIKTAVAMSKSDILKEEVVVV